MMRHQHNFHGNPWYRGYMPRSYIAPHRLASFGCSMCLITFGIFFLIAGTIMTVVSKHVERSQQEHDNDPRFQDDFFKRAREEHRKKGFDTTTIPTIMRTVGVVVLCLGGIFIISAIGLCCFAKFKMDKQSNKHQNQAATPLQMGTSYPAPPPGSYPEQPGAPAGSYPQQPPPPPGSYPQPPPPGYPQYAPVPGSYPSQPLIYPQSAYPYQQQPSPSEPYSSEKIRPYPESQAPANANAPPVGFKEG